MSEKVKKISAIVALVFMAIFVVSLILFCFNQNMFNGAIGNIALWSGGVGLLLFAAIWLTHGFPSQQLKDAERARIYDQAAKSESESKVSSEKCEGDVNCSSDLQ